MSNQTQETYDLFAEFENQCFEAEAVFKTLRIAMDEENEVLIPELTCMMSERIHNFKKTFEALHADWVASKKAKGTS